MNCIIDLYIYIYEFDLDGIETFFQNEFTSSRVLLLIFKTMGINLRKMG